MVENLEGMKLIFIFAARFNNRDMCTYQITIDDQLASQAEAVMSGKASLSTWLQKQVEELLRSRVSGNAIRRISRRNVLSDEALAQLLSQYPSLSDDDFPQLSADDYSRYAHSRSGRMPKGIEKWL